ncbi:MAG TPA: class I SAM-dependent methyltransferase [Candidatus Lokiarchaeia archaeon]|nr:class I SAM-dependent methyltransferase [Candidatus Lokiarchaeia archaeon]
MNQTEIKKPEYGNWVSKNIIYMFGIGGLILLGLSFLFIYLLIAVALFSVGFAYFVYARYKFSPQGGNVQAKIRELVLDHLNWDGKGQAIDIGCGNAPLAISLAQKYPNARVTGIDYWGGEWEYSQATCDANAASEGVADRMTFQKAGASKLPFDDEFFDAAISNLVFHEVRDAKDKRDGIKEALRVVKKGGKFAFQDLFQIKQAFGEIPKLLDQILSWGVEDVAFIDTHDAGFIPKALRIGFMVGTLGILCGTK